MLEIYIIGRFYIFCILKELILVIIVYWVVKIEQKKSNVKVFKMILGNIWFFIER